MSTLAKVNFEPQSDILKVDRRDYPLADGTLSATSNPVCLIDGEWVTLNSSMHLVRATDITTLNNQATVRSFPLFAEKGRYDVRANADKKMPILFMGQYEADTRIFDSTATSHSGAAITFALQPLKVATISFGGRKFTGLVGHAGAADDDPVVGYVTRLPAANGGKLRFITGWRS